MITTRALRHLVVVLIVITALAGCGSSTANLHGQPGTSALAAPSADPFPQRAAVQSLLDTRAKGVLQHDLSAFLAGIDPADTALVQSQTALFDNLAALPLNQWSYDLSDTAQLAPTPEMRQAYGPDVLRVRMTLAYRLGEYDQVADEHDVAMLFVPSGSGLRLVAADDGTDATRHGLWDFGPIVVSKTASTLLIAPQAQAAQLDSLASDVDFAIGAVTSIWGADWPQKAVVIVPGSQQQLGQITGVTTPLDQIAALAIATSVDRDAGTAAGQRVVVNPGNVAKMSTTTRRELFSHEVTHVAARVLTRGTAPLWMQEGIAEYIGNKAVGIAPPTKTQQAAKELAAAAPADLPEDAKFGTGAGDLNATYQFSWLIFQYLDSVIGQQQVIDLYRAAAGATDPVAAFDAQVNQRLGMTHAQFVQAWVGYMKSVV